MNIPKLVLIVATGSFVLATALAADNDQVVRTPSMPDWKLLYRVDPDYPSAALQHHIQGTVRFEAVISRDGHIERLRLLGGHPLLRQAARRAAEQWIYRPTLLGGKPVRVITEIQVQFQLDPYGRPLKSVHREPERRQVL